jgi:CDP-diacylglycerol--glycerol-3-phosphate 3-phosphatidyltransferase
LASIYDLKSRFQALLRPAVRWLASRGVSPNQVTIAATVLSLATGLCVATFPQGTLALLLVPVALFIRMALNAMDGMLAREFGRQSRLGGLLNELGDVVADAAIYLPLALIPGMPAAPLVIFVVLGIITEMAGVVAVQIGAERRYDGPLGKSDRAFAIGLICFLLGVGVDRGQWVSILLIVLSVLAVVTIVRRSRSALQAAGKTDARRAGP